MKDYYKEALLAYGEGDYEKAYYLINEAGISESTPKCKQLLLECQKQISEQYYFLITNHIAHQEYDKATQLKNDFLEKYNFDERITCMIIPKKDVKIEEAGKNGINKKLSVHFKPFIALGIVLIIGIAIFFIFFKNDESEYSIQNDENYTSCVESSTGATIQQQNEASYNTTDQFEYINEKRGNYEVDIEWPVALVGMTNVSAIQSTIVQKAFGYNSNDINSCVERYFKEGEKKVSIDEFETAGKVTVKFQQKLNNLYVFKVQIYADLGGGTGLSIIYKNEYIYFDKDINRSLGINDLFNDYSQTLSLVNEHISLDEYACKAKELSENFIISSSGITFIFPKYSIGYGYQGEVEIALTYEELNNVLSDTFKATIGK